MLISTPRAPPAGDLVDITCSPYLGLHPAAMAIEDANVSGHVVQFITSYRDEPSSSGNGELVGASVSAHLAMHRPLYLLRHGIR